MARKDKGKGKGKRPSAPAESGEELLTMDQAIALLKTSRPTFYRWVRSGKVRGMKVGRQWRFTREEINRFLTGKGPQIELPGDATGLLDQLGSRLSELGGTGAQQTHEEPLTAAREMLVELAVRMRASDVSIEPVAGADPDGKDAGPASAWIRLRVDGVLHPVARFDRRLLRPLVDSWKGLAGVDVNERARPQDGRLLFDPAAEDLTGETIDIRCCSVPATLGESLTMRILRPAEVRLSLDRVGYAPRDLAAIRQALHSPSGMVLVNGPTGTGKTTTLYACLNELIDPGVKVMTVEDPVEVVLPGTVQIPVREDAGATFASVIRSMLRSAPNVMLVGEIRDREIMEVCFQAALTGHLVLTTLHAEDNVAALRRMLDIGAVPFLIGDALQVVISQRLVRRLCPDCSRAGAPDGELAARAQAAADAAGVDWATLPRKFRRPVGCGKCGQTGYRGRTVAAEVLQMTPEIRQALRAGTSAEQLRTIAVGQGMTPMLADGLRKSAEGQTAVEEVLRLLGGG